MHCLLFRSFKRDPELLVTFTSALVTAATTALPALVHDCRFAPIEADTAATGGAAGGAAAEALLAAPLDHGDVEHAFGATYAHTAEAVQLDGGTQRAMLRGEVACLQACVATVCLALCAALAAFS